jgi:hypothetical protein
MCVNSGKGVLFIEAVYAVHSWQKKKSYSKQSPNGGVVQGSDDVSASLVRRTVARCTGVKRITRSNQPPHLATIYHSDHHYFIVFAC